MFADDVKLMATNERILHGLLRLSDKWAATHRMKWSAKKCAILSPPSAVNAVFRLAGENLRTVPQTKYLGF